MGYAHDYTRSGPRRLYRRRRGRETGHALSLSGTASLTLPHFEVRLAAPDLSPWIAGNTGVDGFTTRASGQPGPHLVLISLIHGNELAGAIALAQLLASGFMPRRGRLTVGFANLDAFHRFDPLDPITSRYIDEDLNRVWDPSLLDGPRRSAELQRARAMRPLLETADILLDLHSMLWPSDPLILCGAAARGRRLALAIGAPGLVIADAGHGNGRRLIDHPMFTEGESGPVANLVEAGQHWHLETVSLTLAAIGGTLRALGMAADGDPHFPGTPAQSTRPLYAEVTSVVTAKTAGFTFTQPYRGGEIIPHRNTLLAVDGPASIRTPYDNCLLVMPSLRPSRGHTAVRLARLG